MTTSPRQFLMTMWEGGGTIPPELGIAKRLIEGGHRVHVLGDPTIEGGARNVGCTFTPWQRAPHRTSLDPEQDLMKDWETTNPLVMLRRVRDRFLVGPAGDFAADTTAAIRAVQPGRDHRRLHAVRIVPAVDPYDQQGMLGDLYAYTPDVTDYTYLDFPRRDTLASLPNLIIPNCFERVDLGYVRPSGTSATPMESDDLAIAIYNLADVCVDDGYVDLVLSAIEAQGWAPDPIGGVSVMRDDTNIVLLRDDVLIHLRSDAPETLVELTSFIEQFLVDQPA